MKFNSLRPRLIWMELCKMLTASVVIAARHVRKNNHQSPLLELFEALLLAGNDTSDATTRASILGSSFK
jgi:hypothetical protein